jgi:hypothetical protein
LIGVGTGAAGGWSTGGAGFCGRVGFGAGSGFGAGFAQVAETMRDPDGGPNERATPELVAELTAERDRIDRMIADLTTSRAVLDDVITTAAREL